MTLGNVELAKSLFDSIAKDSSVLSDIMFNSDATSHTTAQTAEEKYVAHFGEVDAEQVEALTDFLNTRADKSQQVAKSKEEALGALERELSDRFEKRKRK